MEWFARKWGVGLLLWCMFALSSLAAAQEPLAPIPDGQDWQTDKAQLGGQLFHDPRFSEDNTVSCATCHPLEQGGMDGQVRSVGVLGREGLVNTPTVFNSSLNFAQMWDGRAEDLMAQIDFPLFATHEMNSSWDKVLPKLRQNADYLRQFALLYTDGMSVANIKDAIVHFERSLITPNGRFDRWLKGQEDALTLREKQGYSLFKGYGCSACHQGRGVGGNFYEKMGVMGNYFRDRGEVTLADYGRYNHTRREEHRYEFKVPSLRNVALTAPYFHDGSAKTLEDAVEVMGRYQLGREIPPEDVAKIVAFLKTLTGARLE
ncbi:Cytochrome-c peroxidase [Magnetococcus marinus MC-1]|uniref:Cytochrome-c peroxidase n=1 Tax=Magnetococcus marinus (strain ATCC BAA-1437 / JCM 17883 / MC-1) TaxID=156889 RepID=A0LBU5_MAGMM|nr:cytochrome c peroxidase [Magnetococcus marinus]ABK45438.1 Cytochrome-c peroxidase [Magnetococcus marinus MC-1]